MNVTVTDTNVQVVSPYSAQFVARAKQINGKWNKPAWVFPKDNEDLVRKLLQEVYGTDGTPQATVTMIVNLSEAEWLFDGSTFRMGPIEAIRKMGRDSQPKLADNCTIVQGRLLASGGSRNNPRITFTDDCVMRVKDVPVSAANMLVEKDSAAFSIVAEESNDTASEWNDEEQASIKFLKSLSNDRLTALLREVGNVK